jgi:uncharacterized protein YbjT (DUF2867 family)
MRVFVAGASGVIGVRLVPLLVARGDTVAGMTRREANAERLRSLGAVPVVCDVFDAPALTEAVSSFAPDAVVHQLTKLPDDPRLIPQFSAENARMRREGTRNLLAAAGAAGAKRFLAQSVAWSLSGDGAEAVRELEEAVLAIGGTVLRYGRFYGDGTYHEHAPPPPPRIHIDEAARRTADALDAPPGVLAIAEDLDRAADESDAG